MLGSVTDSGRRLHVELHPCLWCRDVRRPGIGAEAQLGSLFERPKREVFRSIEVVGGPVVRVGLHKLYSQTCAPEAPTCLDIADDGANSPRITPS